MSGELPEGWAETTMGAVAEVIGGGTPSAKDPANFCSEGGHPWITPADLSDFKGLYIIRGARNLTPKGLKDSSARRLPRGTVLMSSRAPIGYLAIAASEISTNQGFKSFICPSALEPEFVLNWLRSISDELQELGSGSTFAEISGAKAKEIPLRVAPLAEQRRIVEKVEALLEQVNRAKARLDRVPVILKRFRQAVLTAACSGELTREWREANSTSAAAERLQTLSRSESLTDDVDLPPSWTWVPFGSVVVNHDGKRIPIKSADRRKRQGAYPYYGASGIIDSIDAFLFDGDFLLIGEDGANLLSRSSPIAFVASGRFWVNNHAHVVAPKDNALLDFLRLHVNAIDLQDYVTGTAQPKLTQAALNSIPVPLPPLDEQREIVRRVDALFALADAIERRVAAATARAEKLPQAILAKAFAGELVPTEAELARAEGRDYETAEALLARVTAERAAAPATTTRKRRTTKRA